MGYNKVIPTKDGSVYISVINPRLIIVTPIKEAVETLDEHTGEILELNYCEDATIKKNSIFTLGKDKFKIQKITKESSQTTNGIGYYLRTHLKITKTCNFIMPFLGNDRAAFRWDKNFVNAFMGTENENNFGENLYLLYRFDGTKAFSEFEQGLKEHPWFHSIIDSDAHHVLFKFNIPETLKEEIQLPLIH